jgi:hypothetical protein
MVTMNLDDALIWYWQGRFGAEDVTRATGMTERSQRELLKIGVIQAIPQAKTKTRLLGSRMLKRVAVIAGLNRCGLSLTVAGRIVFAAPFVDDFLFDIIDPIAEIFDFTTPYDAVTGLPPKRKEPDPHGWFDPPRPVTTEPDFDWFLEVVDSHFVMLISAQGSDVFGELSEDQTDFLWWHDTVEYRTSNPGTPEEKHLGPKFDHDKSMSAELLRYQVKDSTEQDKERAAFAIANPVTKISVNVSSTLKIALRRLLYIEKPSSI